MVYLPSSRDVRIAATAPGAPEVMTRVAPSQGGLRVRFNRPRRGALIAAYVFYPTAAALAVGGVVALIVQRPNETPVIPISLFAGALALLGAGITTNVVAFSGTVDSTPYTPTP